MSALIPDAGKLIAMWTLGKPAYQIAQVFGCTPATVRRRADRLGLPRDRKVIRASPHASTAGMTQQQATDYRTAIRAGFTADQAKRIATNTRETAQ